jgi:hypothetical protein
MAKKNKEEFKEKLDSEQPEIKPVDSPSEEEIAKSQPEEPVVETEAPVVKRNVPEIKYREVVYLGVADEAERIGAVTSNSYLFHKDNYGMPQATEVDERDYPGLISEKGRGCARRDPQILFMSKMEWDLELEQARIANNS